MQRLLTIDLGCRAYKKVTEPALTELQKSKRVKFAHWVLRNFKKKETDNWLFSDEKYFNLDGVCNEKNDRVWATSRIEANKNGGTHQKRKIPIKVMVWFGACSQGLTSLIILDSVTIN